MKTTFTFLLGASVGAAAFYFLTKTAEKVAEVAVDAVVS